MEKKPKIKQNFRNKKEPVIAQNPENYKKFRVCWQIGFLDLDGRWGWKQWIEEVKYSLDLGKITQNLTNSTNKLTDFLFEDTFNDLNKWLETLQKIEISNENLFLLIKNIKVEKQIHLNKIYKHLKDFESQTWQELETSRTKTGKTRNHQIAISKLHKDAQNRLEKLKLNDLHELFSLRLEGDDRIWGVREFNCLKILWFDSKHEIYEVKT